MCVNYWWGGMNEMKDQKNKLVENENINSSDALNGSSDVSPKKGPIDFFLGATTSLALAWLCFELSKRIVIYFTMHPPSYSSAIAISIASGFKTLVIGISFLATFTFSFIGLGLVLVTFRSLVGGNEVDNT